MGTEEKRRQAAALPYGYLEGRTVEVAGLEAAFRKPARISASKIKKGGRESAAI
jgi:hypothetical protein